MRSRILPLLLLVGLASPAAAVPLPFKLRLQVGGIEKNGVTILNFGTGFTSSLVGGKLTLTPPAGFDTTAPQTISGALTLSASTLSLSASSPVIQATHAFSTLSLQGPGGVTISVPGVGTIVEADPDGSLRLGISGTSPSISLLVDTFVNGTLYPDSITTNAIAPNGSGLGSLGSSGVHYGSAYIDTLHITNALGASVSGGHGAVPVTAAATTTLNCASGNYFVVNMGTNITSWSFTGCTAGQFLVVEWQQDGVGNRTLSGADSTIKFMPSTYLGTDHVAPTLTTTASKKDIEVFVYSGFKFNEVGRDFNL
jgi:hypothetical protein